MNWKIIAIGSFFICTIFISFIGFQTLKNRNITFNNPPNEPNFSLVTFENDVLPEKEKAIIKNEVKSQNQLARGRVIAYNQINNSFSVAMEQKQIQGTQFVIGVIELKIEEKLINEFLCWPEFFKTASGELLDIKTAFFPLQKDSHLVMKGETKHPISELSNYLSSGNYVMALLETSVGNELEVIKDASQLETQYVKELAILGCNETK